MRFALGRVNSVLCMCSEVHELCNAGVHSGLYWGWAMLRYWFVLKSEVCGEIDSVLLVCAEVCTGEGQFCSSGVYSGLWFTRLLCIEIYTMKMHMHV